MITLVSRPGAHPASVRILNHLLSLSFLNDADCARTSLRWAGGRSLIQPPRSIPGRIIRRRRVKLITLPLADVLHFSHTQLARCFEGSWCFRLEP